MTQTVGYWCDPCRRKYVQHKCHEGLPCDHNKDETVYVWAKSYGRGGESFILEWRGRRISGYIEQKKKDPNVMYIGDARFLWGYTIAFGDGAKLPVGEWLHQQNEIIIRAFLGRWESYKEPPEWRVIQLIPEENISILAGREELK